MAISPRSLPEAPGFRTDTRVVNTTALICVIPLLFSQFGSLCCDRRAEDPRLRTECKRQAKVARDQTGVAALTCAAHDNIKRDYQQTIAELHAQVRRYQTAFDSIAQGVCLFDGEARLILCNRRYAEIYRLAPGQLRPGTTLREIAERRVAVGTSPMETDDFLSWRAEGNSSTKPSDWNFALRDGRTIQVHHQPMPDGGWVSTHEDITERHDDSAAANERISLQTLIDWVPDNLWVKDAESRFVIANKATAIRMGFARPEDLIGKTDLELCLPETAATIFRR